MQSLRFVSDLSIYFVAPLAIALAAAAWWLYRRQARRGVSGGLALVLPLLRAAAVLLIVLMLAGPVLRHRQVIGELSRVLVFIDTSRSMSITDGQMPTGRKLLIAQQQGWLPPGIVDTALIELADALAALQADTTGTSAKQATAAFAREARQSLEPMRQMPTPPAAPSFVADFEREVVTPAQALASGAANGAANEQDIAQQLSALRVAASTYEQALRTSFEAYATQLARSGNRVIDAALAKFDGTDRFGRVEAALIEPERGLLDQLRASHHVELISLGSDGDQEQSLWSDVADADLPQTLSAEAGKTRTDLATTLRQRIPATRRNDTAVVTDQRIAAVILSDGQHNHGPPPLQVAQLLGNRWIPLHTVGIGSAQPPRDLAVLRLEAPQSVSRKDRVRGHAVLADHMPAGKPFTLRIEHEGETLWQENLITEDAAVREVAFDFAIDKIVEAKLAVGERDVKVLSLPLSMQAVIDPIQGEERADNNAAPLYVRAIAQRWKLLLIDGRSRWETRYLHNLFDRDERWDVNLILAGPATERSTIPRGDGLGMFPADKQALLAYDLIIFGELPPGLLEERELAWLAEFVENRGGGLVFIDGQRAQLPMYADSPLGPLIPVTWSRGGEAERIPGRLLPTAIGAEWPPLVLTSSAAENAELWKTLPPPHWVADVAVVPGTGEVLVEATIGETRVPVIVERRIGAGRVLYMGTDETWRWRYEVGDLHHARLWHQLAGYVMEPPYAVTDQFVSLDIGTVRYQPGESAELRVRLRDSEGRPVEHATVEAVLMRGGERAATVLLDGDANQGGVFRGKTAPLAEGEYEVAVRVTGFPEEAMKARTRFMVEPADSGEMFVVACNEELLRQMARAAGGQYLREEQIGELPDLLSPLSAGRIIESETVLWQSYWWFTPIVALLSIEWFLRKRSGML